VLNRRFRAAAKLSLIVAAAGLSGASRQETKPFYVYHNGANILFAPEVTGTNRQAKFGPWSLGERLGVDKPLDKRLNLYVVLPGGQYRSPEHPQYDHNRVVNKYTIDGKPRDWDIFYCLALDPTLPGDLRSERDLLVAAHQSFQPSESFGMNDIPTSSIMSEKLSVTNVKGLERFRRKDGSLPRLLIVPAHLAVRAIAEQPPVGPPAIQ
jgi:hypothetical protein